MSKKPILVFMVFLINRNQKKSATTGPANKFKFITVISVVDFILVHLCVKPYEFSIELKRFRK